MRSSDIKRDLKTEALLSDLFREFMTAGTCMDGMPYGNGHIHDTFIVRTAEPELDDYIFQRFNDHVFKDIQKVQENISRVTGHLRRKIENIPGSDPKRETLTIVPAADGRLWLTGPDGSPWRAYLYIPRNRSYETVVSAGDAFEGGRITGRFQALLSDMANPPLHDTIPFFHNAEKRLDTFFRILSSDRAGRAGLAKEECRFVEERAESMKTIHELGQKGMIPVRITHNDTKFNNILFDDDTGKGLCITDLDTVMPGLVHFDFGDAIRTAASTAAEDEKDPGKIGINMDVFRAYTQGYLSEIKGILNSTEVDYLHLAPRVVTFIQGVRFLTDYIDGDAYYKISHDHHNLQRARAQFELVRKMERNEGDMAETIMKIAGTNI